MKRDMELVRKLLLYIEENYKDEVLRSPQINIEGYSRQEISYHLRLMADGGLINVLDSVALKDGTYDCAIEGLTWRGHEFLDLVRDEGAWSNVKGALKPVGTVSFEVIKNLAVAYVSAKLGL